MERRVCVRSGVSPAFRKGLAGLPVELRQIIFRYATHEHRSVMANRIRLAWRRYKRHRDRDPWPVILLLYVPSAHSGDTSGPRIVTGFLVY